MDWLLGPFADPAMARALAACVALAFGGAPIGVFLVLRRTSLIGDALSHAILPGVAIAFVFAGFSILWMTVGGLLAGMAVAILSAAASRVTALREDASLAAFFIISLALGTLLVATFGTDEELLHILFGQVLATEMSKISVAAAEHNLTENQRHNVAIARLASEEISAALQGVRAFRRLRDIDLTRYRFSTLFVDPPRSGLDPATLALAAGFPNILYISCNPHTLRDNVEALAASHHIAASALFDQFPYTPHLECGLLLKKNSP